MPIRHVALHRDVRPPRLLPSAAQLASSPGPRRMTSVIALIALDILTFLAAATLVPSVSGLPGLTLWQDLSWHGIVAACAVLVTAAALRGLYARRYVRRSMNDESKRYGEAMTMAYHRQQGVDTRVARIFNTYGPRMRPNDGRAVPNIRGQALAGEPLTVFGDGAQTMSFCYVDDLMEGLFRLATSGEHEPVNLGNPAELTLTGLAEAIIEVTGSQQRDRLLGAADRRPQGAAARHHEG